MGKWVRVKDDSGIEKVSLVVRKEADPEVYAWLQDIPYGKVNAYLKMAILAFIRNGNGKTVFPSPVAPADQPDRPDHAQQPLTRPVASQQAVDPRPEPRSESRSLEDPYRREESRQDQPTEQALEGIDARTLAMMKEIEGRF